MNITLDEKIVDLVAERMPEEKQKAIEISKAPPSISSGMDGGALIRYNKLRKLKTA